MSDNPVKIIGREKEIQEIQELYASGKAEMLAVYGRRRVGKTFLVDNALKNRITIRHAGLSPVEVNGKNSLKEQLKHFYLTLKLYGCKEQKCPQSWQEAFFYLEQLLRQLDDGSRQVVFLDELPWLDTPRSGFITAFEGFWNTWACHRDNFMLVVCGSSNSWILNNLIDSHGGLYGRTTYEIKLSPFTLSECKSFYQSKNIQISDYDIVQSYMILGGIPYYIGYIKKNLSLAQNIDNLFWSKNAKLRDEFNRLFDSAFDTPEEIKKIVRFLGKRHSGYTRKEIVEKAGIDDGGMLSKRLKALVASDFVSEYIPFGEGARKTSYKLSDPFCIFYLHFIEGQNSKSENFWSENQLSQSIISWRGIAFEEVCFNHIRQIKKALGISGVSTRESAWNYTDENSNGGGVQIDLMIERKDHVINMCEIKFYNEEYSVTKEYEQKIQHRINVLSNFIPKRCAIHPTIITTFGLKQGMYSGVFIHQISIKDLFDF